MKLSDAKIRGLKPKEKQFKLADGDGMYILIKPNGTKLWRLKYRFNGKENIYSIGTYPEVTLERARKIRLEIRQLLHDGIEPNQKKRIDSTVQANSEQEDFQSIAYDWHEKNCRKWTQEHSNKLKNWIEKDVLPYLGHYRISEIKSPDVLDVIRRIEKRGANDVARRVLSICSQIFRYAIPLGKCDYDVTVGINNTLEVRKRTNFKCVTVDEFPKLIQDIQNHNCNIVTKSALKLIVLTFVRSSELREAKWSEINFERGEWRIPADRMKMREQHIVPISSQANRLLQDLNKITSNSDYIFPNINNPNKVMSENTMLYALYDMGYYNKMTVHGFRQIASTILNENNFSSDAIERQLSHAERDNVRRAYNHAQYLPERKQMMQWWGDYIEGLSNEW